MGTIQAEIDHGPMVSAAIRAMRPHQWSKNLLVFVPMLAAQAFGEVTAWMHALCILASFCATASGVYILNDLLDLTADRCHPRKRHRPLASGAISIPAALTLAGALLATGIALAFQSGAALLVVAYAVASISYSLALKQFPLLDVFLLAGLYTQAHSGDDRYRTSPR